MEDKIIEKWDKTTLELARTIKTSNAPSIYSYMVISTSTIFDVYFEAVNSVEPQDFPFSTKEKYKRQLRNTKPLQIKKTIVFFLLDYFAFLQKEMDSRFFDTFPISYEELLEGFNLSFASFKSETSQLNKVIEKYEYPFHSREVLRRTGLPKEQEDSFLIHTLNEFKHELFHQFNKNIARIINAAKN